MSDRTPFETLRSSVVALPKVNIDTDQIIPGRFLQKPRSENLGRYLFHDLRFRPDGSEAPDFVLNRTAYRRANMVVAAQNFGCGSSRENAVWALHDFGIRAVIAPSFGDIFRNNSLKNGLLPVVLAKTVVHELLDSLLTHPGQTLAVDLTDQTVTLPDGSRQSFEVEPFARHCLLEGIDELDYTLSRMDEIAAFERQYEDL